MARRTLVNLHQLRAFFLATLICSTAHAAVPAPAYKATLLHPSGGYTQSDAEGIFGTTIVGSGRGPNTGGNFSALMWNSSQDSVVDLTPAGFDRSTASDIWGKSQVGSVSSPTIVEHAALWYGSADSFVDLHLHGYYGTHAHAVWNNSQVGFGRTLAEFEDRALLWSSSPTRAVNLHPPGFMHSVARDVEGNTQVGDGYIFTGGPNVGTHHALLWHGSAASVVDLHPAGYSHSLMFGISGNTQVGYAQINPSSGPLHALLWHGTVESVVNLHPLGFNSSFAHAAAGDLQVGFGSLEGTGARGDSHALLWNGTADTVVNLHQYLTGLPITFTDSFAHKISANGVIVGTARDSNGLDYAVMWTPIPEPSAALLFLVGCAVIRVARARCR
jgi:hypothetical protein